MTRGMTSIRPQPRLAPPPRTEPPYDDEIGASSPARRPEAATQGTLALTFTLPSGVSVRPSPPAHLRLVADEPACSAPGAVDQVSPDAQAWAGTLAQAVVEVLAGDRPVGQLLRWTSGRVYAQLSRRAAAAARECTAVRASRARAIVRRVYVSQPAEGVAEASAVVSDGRRTRAMALRLQKADGRWVCAALELG